MHSITTYSSSMIAVLSTGENIGLGQPTKASSALDDGPPSNAVDGDTNGNYAALSCSHTLQTGSGGTAYHWWAVDFGSTRYIDAVYIYNRVDCECDFCTSVESGVCFYSSPCVLGPHSNQ